ncbi:MAG: hypothetical protein JXR76_13335 [Deltaproteobacteria bacterium]|nr:hypothetical protein [Deltaproteobacteria bacterium]
MKISDVPIARLLAHRPPILMLDKAVAHTDNGVICEVEIRSDHVFFTPNGVPAYVAVEFMAQAIGVYDGWFRYQHQRPPRIGYLVGTRQLTLNCDYFAEGQVLKIEANLAWDGVNLVQFRCAVKDKATEAELASATINVYSPTRDSSDLKEEV